jgi:hypothetical protein
MAIGSPQWMYSSGADAYEIDQSLKFNDDDSAYLSRTPASAGNRRTWTFSCWFKWDGKNDCRIFQVGASLGTSNYYGISSYDGKLNIEDAGSHAIHSTALFRDPSAWYHIVLAMDTTQSTASNRVKIYINGEQVTDFSNSATYPAQDNETAVNRSGITHAIGAEMYAGPRRFMDGYIAEVNLVDGQALTPSDFGETGDYGEWKPIEYSGSYGTNGFYLPFKQDYTVEGFSTVTYKGNESTMYVGGTGFKPDLVWFKQRDGTRNNTLIDSVRGGTKQLFSNSTGSEETYATAITSFDTDGFTIGSQYNINEDNKSMVAWNWDMGADTPTGFSAVTYTGNGTARSIAGLGFQPDLVWFKERNNAVSHRVFDSVRGATKRIFPNNTGAESTQTTALTSFDTDGFSLGTGGAVNGNGDTYVAWGWDMGNTTVTNTSGSISSQVRANPTYGQSIVSWSGNSQANASIGHGLSSAPDLVITKSRTDANDWVTDVSNITGTTGDALRLNNTTSITANASILPTKPSSSVFYNSTDNGSFNVSNKNYISYCFHSVSGYSKFGSYTGNGNTSSGNAITTGFKPAFLMIKRTDATSSWTMFDNVRDVFNPHKKRLNADEDAIEASFDYGVNFDSTGFTVMDVNTSDANYIYMAFAGGMDSISDYNTDGSIDSRVKANTTYGQSIVSYTGTGTTGTVGHGLSSAPDMYIVKNRDAADDWAVYHTSLGNAKRLSLNDNVAEQSTNNWNSTSPTSSAFTVYGGENRVNDNGEKYIAYCFHDVTGYSKFGSYTGTGSNVSVTTGFAPAFTMVKRVDSGDSWFIFDNTREPDGVVDLRLEADTTASEASVTTGLTYTSTGFTVTSTNGAFNASGGTYIYMAFADKREYAYWLDQSGNNNDWTSNNLTESDISVDSPTNNFATLNPLKKKDVTLSEGNLKSFGGTGGSGDVLTHSTFGVSSGKWYAEFAYTKISGDASYSVGIQKTESTGAEDLSYRYYAYNGNKYQNSSGSSYGASYTAGDIIGIALDMDAGTLTFYKNNVSQGTAFTSISGEYNFYGIRMGGAEHTGVWNFGQDSSFAGGKTAQGNQDGNDIGDFYYTPPTGFLALCTSNLPDVDVVPSEHFNTITYTGTGSSLAISNVGFQPDFVWAKKRSEAGYHHLFDAIRGATKVLYSNTTDAEETTATSLTSFDSDGFTIGNAGGLNVNNATGVAWNWKAGTSVSGNTTGSGTAQSYTGSVNSDAGFSIIKYTGNGTDGMQVPHHLGVVPDAIFIKSLTVQSWNCFFPNALGADKGLQLNNTGAQDGPFYSTHLSDTMPTTSLVTLGNGAATNTYADGVGQDYIMYCWANKDGYSKVGSYTGNGNADGTFVYTGFRPKFVMFKSASSSSSWLILDSARNLYNLTNNNIRANESGAAFDSSFGVADFLSNGFKPRASSNDTNADTYTYIYIAFAETPFKYSNAR